MMMQLAMEDLLLLRPQQCHMPCRISTGAHAIDIANARGEVGLSTACCA